MKRLLIAVALLLFAAPIVLAQQGPDAPASREDIERYMKAIHSDDLVKQIFESMAKPMHDMVHDQYLKERDKLPPDFEARTNRMLDSMLNEMPVQEMQQAMVPAYQKHFTKGDMDALVAFYSSATGQKVLRDLPAIMSEAMESMRPVMQKYTERINQRLQDEFAAAKKESRAGTGKTPAPSSN